MTPRPTLKSVAAAAGVSTAQVSYAFNRPDRLSASARAHILAVAREQGYSGPDAAARSLRTGRAGAIGVIFTIRISYAFSDPYLLALLGGLAEVAEQTRTGLVLIPFDLSTAGQDHDAVRQSLDAVHRAVIDGAIAEGPEDDHPAVQALRDRKIPLIRSSMALSGRSVAIDDRAAGAEIGRHLAAFGHQDVVVMVASLDPPGTPIPAVDEHRLYPYSRLRLAGIRDGLGPVARVGVVSGGPDAPESGRVAAAQVLDQPDRPSAIAAESDIMATGVLEAVRLRGLEPGRDISVTGFDDVPMAALGGLTTIRQAIRDKGRLMGRMLLDPTFTEERIVLPTQLVVRSSTGPARPQRSRPATTTHRQTSPERGSTVTNDLLADSPNRTGSEPDPQWHSDRLDLDAYLRRIGYAGPLEANGQTLAALHRAHIGAIAFENLDIILGRGIAVDLEHVQAKLVDRRRGGYCYEHGMLFGAVAERLGFQVDRLLARTGDPAEQPRPRSHLVLRVATPEEQWLADVGFGSGLLAPLRLTASGPQKQGVWEYELRQGSGSTWRLRQSDGQSWTTIMTFTEEPQYFVDIEVANYNTATNPKSAFVHRPIVVRKDDTSLRQLLGRDYSIERPGRATERRRLTDTEFADLLRSDFGPVLSEAEVSALVAALPAETTGDSPVPDPSTANRQGAER